METVLVVLFFSSLKKSHIASPRRRHVRVMLFVVIENRLSKWPVPGILLRGAPDTLYLQQTPPDTFGRPPQGPSRWSKMGCRIGPSPGSGAAEHPQPSIGQVQKVLIFPHAGAALVQKCVMIRPIHAAGAPCQELLELGQ